MMKPTIHLNGTAPETLLGETNDAINAISAALTALYKAVPNARDYYPQGEKAFGEAVIEHGRRVNSLRSAFAELNELSEYISDEMDKRAKR